ncbi:MAG: hypothetical protein EXR71_07595 [Myxococcales bacterium]|nr:hypothetical protein [Myxococcales bacterium]
MFWLLLVACESMPTSGRVFSPASVAASAQPVVATGAADPRFVAPDPFRISSEEMAGETSGGEGEDALGPVDAAVAARPVAPAPVPSSGATGVALFPVRLVSTMAQAQPPRAVLGLPDGSEIVVSPGSVLGPEALVVMAVMDGRVQVARVRAAGDHAQIESVELTAQY